ncbi:hypothetical protein FRB91_005776 [Serendipita sp. 411]|nr:hypothetical protein FRB91_005776 [Serendipita sp. 411]
MPMLVGLIHLLPAPAGNSSSLYVILFASSLSLSLSLSLPCSFSATTPFRLSHQYTGYGSLFAIRLLLSYPIWCLLIVEPPYKNVASTTLQANRVQLIPVIVVSSHVGRCRLFSSIHCNHCDRGTTYGGNHSQ